MPSPTSRSPNPSKRTLILLVELYLRQSVQRGAAVALDGVADARRFRRPAVPYKEMRADAQGATSDQMRERIERARTVQHALGHVNSELPPRLLRKLCRLDDAGERTLELAMRKMGLSARAHDRILKVARTIADLDASESVSAKHLAEAVQYRSLDRSYWS